jgi:hypothetical protein
MTLPNLQRIGKIKDHAPTAADIVTECLCQAKALRKLLRAHLASKHPDLLKKPA